MKNKNRVIAILLSLVMVLAFMPAMVFADTGEDATPVSLTYEGPAATYEPWDGPTSANVYKEGAKIIIKYSDGAEKVAVCKQWGGYTDDEGNTWPWYDYFFEGEEPIIVKENGDEYPENAVWFYFDFDNATAVSLSVEFDGAKGMIPLVENHYVKPVKAEFVAPEDFEATGYIGDYYAYEWQLGGDGNKFIISYDDNTVKEFIWDEGRHCFVYTPENGEKEEFWAQVRFDKRIPKGTNQLSGKVRIENQEGERWVDYNLPVSVKVNAKLYYAYVEYKAYPFTGKMITPKVVVKYFDGTKMKTMPAKWYTYSAKKGKKMGWYGFDVKIKKAYQKKYGYSLWCGYDIVPKTPVIKKVAAGADGKATVTWTKFSKAHQKSITGFYVQYTEANSSWNDGWWVVKAKKSAGKATMKGLEPGTKYKVRIVAYKTSKGDEFASKPSKAKTFTAK